MKPLLVAKRGSHAFLAQVDESAAVFFEDRFAKIPVLNAHLTYKMMSSVFGMGRSTNSMAWKLAKCAKFILLLEITNEPYVSYMMNTLDDCDLLEKVVNMTNVHEHNDVTVSIKVQQFRSRCENYVYYTYFVCE